MKCYKKNPRGTLVLHEFCQFGRDIRERERTFRTIVKQLCGKTLLSLIQVVKLMEIEFAHEVHEVKDASTTFREGMFLPTRKRCP